VRMFIAFDRVIQDAYAGVCTLALRTWKRAAQHGPVLCLGTSLHIPDVVPPGVEDWDTI
jgi:hypothetical protein